MVFTIDIGTTFIKIAVFDYTGAVKYAEKRSAGFSVGSDQFEVDPLKWATMLKKLCTGVPVKILLDVECIVVSGNGPTFIPVDKSGVPVGNALLWSDNRAIAVADEIETRLGYPLLPNFFLSKAYWFKKELNDKYRRTETFLSCPEYISFLLTGEKFTLLQDPGFMDYYWDDEKIDKLGLDRKKFPEYITPYQIYGYFKAQDIIPELTQKIPVICGGADYSMSLLGTGAVNEGIVCDRTGTSEGINFTSSINQQITGLRTLPHISKGKFTIAGLIPEAGSYLLNGDLTKIVDEYSKIIDKFLGNGLKVNEIRVVGGHATVDKLNRLKAEAFPFPLKIYPEWSDLAGNAVLGSVIIGKYKSIELACSSMIKEKICYNV